MSLNKWVYEKATGKWLLGFRDPSVYLTDSVRYGLADLGESQPQPDAVFERWDATTLRRPATPTEIAESRQEQQQYEGRVALDGSKVVRAVVMLQLWSRLGRQPTLAEVAAERARFLAIYSNL